MRRRWVTFQGAVGSQHAFYFSLPAAIIRWRWLGFKEEAPKYHKFKSLPFFCLGSALNVCGKPMNFPDERPYSKASPKTCKNVKQRSFRLDWKGFARKLLWSVDTTVVPWSTKVHQPSPWFIRTFLIFTSLSLAYLFQTCEVISVLAYLWMYAPREN